jgi:predicted Zn-dependent protease
LDLSRNQGSSVEPYHRESERNAREPVASCRRLTLEEIQAVVVAHKSHHRAARRHRGIALASHHRGGSADGTVRVLNGLEPHAQVKARDRVKIVVD